MKTRGFSTLEILIAMSVLFLVLGAVILVSFGNQTAVADSQTAAEALNYAQRLLEEEQADGRKDFNLVNSFSTTSPDGFYTAVVTATLQSDYLTKEVKATISWNGENLRTQSTTLSVLVTNFTNAVGANTCDSSATGNWKSPVLKQTYDLATLVGDAAGTYPITDVDAYQNKLYVTTSNPSGPITQPNFFVFTINNPTSANPTLSFVSKTDTDPLVASGISAVAVAKNSAGTYAYLANASGITKGQFQVIDLTSSALTSYKIPGLTAGVGNSVTYRDGYVYLGLTSTGGQGKEFSVIDVHTPTSPFVRSYASINAAVNQIYVKGLYAYLATADSQKLKVYSISNPNSVQAQGGFAGSGNTGKSVYAVGDSIYLGTTASGATFHTLNGADPGSLVSQNSVSAVGSVDGIIVRDSLAFLLINKFGATPAALRIINATSTAAHGSLAIPVGGSALYEPVMDCEGNTFFVGSNSATDQGTLYLITPGV